MSMNYRVRIVLDTDEDVIRDIELNGKEKLNVLHESILSAFDLYTGEMASFFLSNEDWEQGAEISLENFGNTDDADLMASKCIADVIPEKGDRMIYVYDFLNLWTFFLEVIAIDDTPAPETPLIHILKGVRPQEAPAKVMESVNLSDDVYLEDPGSFGDETNWDDFQEDQ